MRAFQNFQPYYSNVRADGDSVTVKIINHVSQGGIIMAKTEKTQLALSEASNKTGAVETAAVKAVVNFPKGYKLIIARTTPTKGEKEVRR